MGRRNEGRCKDLSLGHGYGAFKNRKSVWVEYTCVLGTVLEARMH